MNALTADLSSFPVELKSRRIWCVWRLEERAGRQTKVPYQPIRTGDNYTAQLAKSNDPATWVSFEEVAAAVNGSGGWGVGLFCDGTFTFIDLDHCRDPLTGELTPWAAAIVERVGSYCELSPSETGLHIFALGAVPAAIKKSNVEMYSKGRFATVTGKHHSGRFRPFDVASLRADVEAGRVGHKGLIAERGASVEDLEAGSNEGDGSNSSGDWAFVRELIKQGLSDEQIHEKVRNSSRMRGKWDERRGNSTYGQQTIDRARLAFAEEAAQDSAKSAPTAPDPWEVQPLTSVTATPVDWICKGFLAKGKLTTISGEPGHGKSLIALDAAARVTTGRDFAYSKNAMGAADVLLLTLEEDAADTVKPRFLAAGGDANRLFTLLVGGRPGAIHLEDSSDRFRQLLADQPTIKLVILDPLLDYVRAEQNKDREVRETLLNLVDIASACGVAIIGINHLNKKSDLDAMHRVAGARGWTSVSRLNFLVGKGEDDARHFVQLKVNLYKKSASLDFRIGEKSVTEGRITSELYPVIEWTGRGSATANDITMSQKPKAEKADLAARWLAGFLQDTLGNCAGWKLASDVFKAGDDEGYSKRALQRAAQRIGIVKEQRGMPAVMYWCLPDDPAATVARDDTANPCEGGRVAPCATGGDN